MVKHVQFSALSIIFLNILLITSFTEVKSQCSGGGLLGSITPTTAWQTTCIQGGQYVTFAATIGRTYTFSFCQGGGSYSFDTQITILDNGGSIVSGAYNDDYCAQGSHLVFIAPATATYRVLIAKYNCTADATCQTMAYTRSAPLNDNICSATYLYSNSCTCTFKTSSNSLATASPQADPGCANYAGRDVWFSTKAPSSGQLIFDSQAGAITDGAMAVYKGSSCTGALTLLACDDDAGAGTMPQISLAGLTPGDSLFIRFWSYDNAEVGNFGICIHDPAPYYCMAGNASEINPGTCIQVTPNKQTQQGCIWNTTQIDMSTTFDYTYTVNLGSNDAGADGLTFTLQNNAAGLSACGDPGVALGIGPVTNTFIIEFDTYDNGVGAADIAVDHTAISVNGNLAAPVAGPVQASSTSANIEDGLNHTVRIVWDPATMVFDVYFDGVLRLSYTNDIINTVFGGNPNVYWGFTGSTGLYTNTQYLCPGNLPGVPPSLPVTWGSFNAELVDEKAFITWTTLSESDNKEFVVERSQDGLKFAPIGSVKGLGNSSIVAKYQFIDPAPLSGTSYYRINQVDYNGASSYSQARTINNTTAESQDKNFCKIFPNPVSSQNAITAQLEADASVELYDNLGNRLMKDVLKKGPNVLTLAGGYLEAGIYHFVLRSANSVQFITLVVTGR